MAADEHDDQPLTGGIANAGAIVPAVATSCGARPTLPRPEFRADLGAAGFEGAPTVGERLLSSAAGVAARGGGSGGPVGCGCRTHSNTTVAAGAA